MSIDRCYRCAAAVDTDYDDDCYQPDPRMSLKPYPDVCVCKQCREREADEREHYVSTRAREIRYGDGCSIEQARQWANEEFTPGAKP